MRKVRLFYALVLLCVPVNAVWAQTGKITGQVTDASTGESLPSVNVVIADAMLGAATDRDGYYVILNVRPGAYTLRASFVGFTPEVVENVRVSTGLTTEVNIVLQEEAIGLDELVVTSRRPIVQLDVSANVASLSAAEIQDLPMAGITDVLDLQAGVEPGLQIRGGGLDEVAFVVDGLNLRTGRNQNPITGISFTALEEVQVQTGGFNAEYGNVRAGLVNVTTKEPPRHRYTFDGLFRIAPPQDKSRNALHGLPATGCDYTGDVSPDCDARGIRPWLDPAVAYEGTDNWDPYTRRQYDAFDGWNETATRFRNSGFDVTAEDLIERFQYEHRKDNEITIPDYEADFTFGGPLIPGLSERLGDLRFLFSYRGTQTAYLLPQARASYDENTFQLKVATDVRPGMKLTLHGMVTTERGMNSPSVFGVPGISSFADPQARPDRGNLPAYPWQVGAGSTVDVISDAGRGGGTGLANVDHTVVGARFTHMLGAHTFYEVSAQHVASKYRDQVGNLQDASFICPGSGVGPDGERCQPGVFINVGWTDGDGRVHPEFAGLVGADVQCFGGTSDLNGDGVVQPYCVGETFGQGRHSMRDTTDASVFTGRFDVTSQINRFLQLKTGAELIVSDYDVNATRFYTADPNRGETYPFSRSPIQGAAYAQGKLEFEGMIANLGLRLDYFDPNKPWWVLDGPYDFALRWRSDALDARLPKAEPKAQIFVSPRLGVSFPINASSKLYFNYGHFRQMLDAFSVFGLVQSESGGIQVLGNPDHPMPLTTAYELGFDQNLFDQFLLRVSGFYRDIREQPRMILYEGYEAAIIRYYSFQPWNYEDIRGAEFTLTKNRGRWVRGFINYTFLQKKGGNFGYAQFYENSFDQLTYLRTSTDYRLDAPLAEPFARMNLMLFTPQGFGPTVAGAKPLSDWRVSLVGEWRSGQKWIWPGSVRAAPPPELQENVQWRDWWEFDLRLTKHLTTRWGHAQLFIDVNNVFNRRHLYGGADDDYMQSLHLPADIFDALLLVDADLPYSEKVGLPYSWVPGDDRPGDFRKPGVAFQPIEAVPNLDAVHDSNEIAWYWAKDTGTYARWNGGAWEPVPEKELKQALDDKAYIDMPNLRPFTFLNPRRITLGLRVIF